MSGDGVDDRSEVGTCIGRQNMELKLDFWSRLAFLSAVAFFV